MHETNVIFFHLYIFTMTYGDELLDQFFFKLVKSNLMPVDACLPLLCPSPQLLHATPCQVTWVLHGKLLGLGLT
jgi:hypothetical protein